MRAWLPRSLYGRIVLILTAGVIGAQLIGASLHLSERFSLISQTMTSEFAQQIAAVYRTINSQPEVVRPGLVSALSRSRMVLALQPSEAAGADTGHASPDQEISSGRDSLVFRFSDELERAMGRDVKWRLLHVPAMGDLRFVVELELSDGQLLQVTGAPPEEVLGQPWHLLMGLVAMLLVIILLVMIVARNTVKPLTRLAQAAHGVAQDLRHPQLDVSGPSEVQEAARAFNTMQKRIRDGIEERERFLAAVSHDLKTPVTRLRLRAEMLPDNTLRVDIERDVNEMQSLIDDTLDFLRGRSVDEPLQMVDLVALIESVADDFSYDEQVTVDVPDQMRFRGRPIALQRALRNLVDNAIKYGNCAHVSLRQQGQDIMISVDDQGQGIAVDKIEAVFDPFFRLEESRSRETGGSGLGLAIVRLVAQSHGGSVQLFNRPEGGLRAMMVLPIR